MNDGIVDPHLSGVPETMLITLYYRASEAKRPDGILHDPESIRIYESIDFDFENIFGPPRGSMASRAVCFDRLLKEWLREHPEGLIVSLGEGLETQSLRVDNGKMHWLSVDLPEAIQVREQFFKPNERFSQCASSAFAMLWMDQVKGPDIFIIAQGLFMYFEESKVRQLIDEIFKRFPNAHLAFDFVSKSFVKQTQKGLSLTGYYTLPAMKWGISHKKLYQFNNVDPVRLEHYDIFPRGFSHIIVDRILKKIPFIGNQFPGIAYVKRSPQ